MDFKDREWQLNRTMGQLARLSERMDEQPWRCKFCIWEQFCKNGQCVSFISKESVGVPPKSRLEE